jgi:hypothetical protein
MNPTIVEQHPPQADSYADRNLALLDRLIDLQIADPDRFAVIPEGATVVIVQASDRDFTRHNLNLLFAALDQGGEAVLFFEEALDDPDAYVIISRAANRPDRLRAVTTIPFGDARVQGGSHYTALMLEYLDEAWRERAAS